VVFKSSKKLAFGLSKLRPLFARHCNGIIIIIIIIVALPLAASPIWPIPRNVPIHWAKNEDENDKYLFLWKCHPHWAMSFWVLP
jgi:hypothetical protein